MKLKTTISRQYHSNLANSANSQADNFRRNSCRIVSIAVGGFDAMRSDGSVIASNKAVMKENVLENLSKSSHYYYFLATYHHDLSVPAQPTESYAAAVFPHSAAVSLP